MENEKGRPWGFPEECPGFVILSWGENYLVRYLMSVWLKCKFDISRAHMSQKIRLKEKWHSIGEIGTLKKADYYQKRLVGRSVPEEVSYA